MSVGQIALNREQLVEKRRGPRMQPPANTSMYLAVKGRKICRANQEGVLRKAGGETVQRYHGNLGK